MNEIKCPKCGEVFTIDEASYASIVKQVRDNEFNAEIRKMPCVLQRRKVTKCCRNSFQKKIH